ncbi:MAG: hypothetical protein OXG34_01465 [bacterium]|nr:hypothetical protein [bacterium]
MRYAADNPGIRLSILVAGVIAFFGQPIIHLVVIFANDVFKVGETQYGILAAATGVGAMLNTPLLAGLPLGAQLQGFLADVIGPRIAVGGAGVLLAATALWWVISGRTKVLDLN